MIALTFKPDLHLNVYLIKLNPMKTKFIQGKGQQEIFLINSV